MLEIVAIVEILGDSQSSGHPIRSAEELQEWIRQGLPFSSLEAVISRFNLHREELAATLALPARTLARRKLEQRLRPDESDRLVRFVRITQRASEVLGDEGKAMQWLRTPNRALESEAPITWLDTDLGTRQIEEMLGRVEHGMFS